MIDNLNCIKEDGIEKFIKKEMQKWKCKTCGELICCHNGLCLNCQIDTLQKNKKYHYDS
jgi:hypothetical protein